MLLLKHHSLIVTSSLRGFNFSRYSLTWLLSNIVFWEGFSSMTPAFSDIDDLFPDFVKHISSTYGLHCSRAVCWFYWGSCLSLIVICKDFLGFYFPFSQISLNSNFILLFPEIGGWGKLLFIFLKTNIFSRNFFFRYSFLIFLNLPICLFFDSYI